MVDARLLSGVEVLVAVIETGSFVRAAEAPGLSDSGVSRAVARLEARLGEALRARLNGLCEAAGAPVQFTGIGSMLAVHTMRGAVRSPADAAKSDAKLKELFFFDLLAHGIWLARRGMMTVSLPIGDAECDQLADAVQEFLSVRRSLFR